MATGSHQGMARLRGEAVYLFAYDIAYELSGEMPERLLGSALAEYRLDASKRNPRHLVFYRPKMVRLPPQERIGPHGPVRVERDIKILPIGAISIRVRVPFEVDGLDDLVAYHDLRFNNGALHEEIRQLAESVRKELGPYVLRPIEAMSEEEAYTVFCLESPVRGPDGNPLRAEVWLDAHRREVAALLTQEEDQERLSRQEAIESTARSLSYYEDDLAVMDWDAALVVDEPSEWEETLYVLELANLQLAELEAYDRLLDATLERSYRDLGVNPLRPKKVLITELREMRVDMARFSDELSNITKFLGDWHLAKLYEIVASRFHLSDWKRGVEEKLKTVGELHELLKSDQSNRWMMILEVTIVVLFILDVAIIWVSGK